MKKRVFPLALILALCLSLCAQAATPRVKNSFEYVPYRDVAGKTATCTLSVKAEESSAKITANISLQVKSGSGSYTTLCGWSTSGTKSLSFNKSDTDTSISAGNCRMQYTVTVTGSKGTDTVSGYVYG